MSESNQRGTVAMPPSVESAADQRGAAAHQLTFPVWMAAIAVTAAATLSAVSMVKGLSAQAWEYKITSPPDEVFQNQANSEGLQGWEMVTARRATSSSPLSPTCYEVIWKRRLVKEKEKQPWER